MLGPKREVITSHASRYLSTRSYCLIRRPPRSPRCLNQSHSVNHLPPIRPFAATPARPYAERTVQSQQHARRSGPYSIKAAVFFLIVGAGLIVYFRTEKARLERRRVADMSKGVGKPKVGGPFTLIDHDGKEFTDADMKGGFSIVYFGFTHCPDICPDELDKVAKIIDLVNTSASSSTTIFPSSFVTSNQGNESKRAPLLPLFITCDPARDTPAVLRTYLKEFHPGLVGLTGTWDQIKDVCKKYRVYFSTPPDAKVGEDYLVDHSIYFYVMDPEGDFIEAIGRQHSPESAAKIIVEHISDWNADGTKRK